MENLSSLIQKQKQVCASECNWLPPDLEEVEESRCYEGNDWKCRWEKAVRYCKNCPNYEISSKVLPCDKCKREKLLNNSYALTRALRAEKL